MSTIAEKYFLEEYEQADTEEKFYNLCRVMREKYDWSNEDLFYCMKENGLIEE